MRFSSQPTLLGIMVTRGMIKATTQVAMMGVVLPTMTPNEPTLSLKVK